MIVAQQFSDMEMSSLAVKAQIGGRCRTMNNKYLKYEISYTGTPMSYSNGKVTNPVCRYGLSEAKERDGSSGHHVEDKI